jgi:hypothetical protein
MGTTRGSLLYRGASGWAALTPGTSGHALVSNGTGADPSYQSVAGSVAIGNAVTGGTAGSLLYVATGPVLAQDNSNLFYDTTNKRLGIGGTTSPAARIHTINSNNTGLGIRIENSGATGASGKYLQLSQIAGSIGVTGWTDAAVIEGLADGGVAVSSFAGPFTLQTGGARTTRATLDTSGNFTLKGGAADLYWQSSTNSLAIGTTSPGARFHVSGSSVDSVGFRLENASSSGTAKYVSFHQGGSAGFSVTDWANAGILEASSAGGLVLSGYEGTTVFQTGNSRTRAGIIDSSQNWKFGPGTPSARIHALVDNAVTNALSTVSILGHDSTGTPAAGFGAATKYQLESSTTAAQDAAQIAALWTTATHASRTAELTFSTVDNAGSLAERARVTAWGFLFTPVAFASLGTPTNGTLTYCSDCVKGGNPCAGSGTGAFAQRLNSVWRCD